MTHTHRPLNIVAIAVLGTSLVGYACQADPLTAQLRHEYSAAPQPTATELATVCKHIATGYPAPNYDLLVEFKADHRRIICPATDANYGYMNMTWTTPIYRTLLTTSLHRTIVEGEGNDD